MTTTDSGVAAELMTGVTEVIRRGKGLRLPVTRRILIKKYYDES